jgi:transcriptional regulator with XRE-family HTH domain
MPVPMTRRNPRHYIRRARLKAGITQRELGVLLGVSDTTIRKYENEQRTFGATFILGCMLIFGQSAAELFPDFAQALEERIGRNAAILDAELAGMTDAVSLKKLALLRDIANRSASFEL